MAHIPRRTLIVLLLFAAALVGCTPAAQRPLLSSIAMASNTSSTPAKATPPPAEVATVVMVGDVMLARALAPGLLQSADPLYPFAHVAPLLQAADVSTANAENPIGNGEGKPRTPKTYVFRAPPAAAQALAAAGFKAVSLANNHAGDFGPAGVVTSLHLLRAAGVGTFGAGENEAAAATPYIATVKGTRIAFLGLNDIELPGARASGDTPGVFSPSADELKAAVAHARQQADFVVVMPHWGLEYQRTPTERQRQLADLLMQAGADLVVGAHPHVSQTVEWVDGKPVVYSLGNFAFDGMEEKPGATTGMLVRFQIRGQQLISLEQLPIAISPGGVPSPAPQLRQGTVHLEITAQDVRAWQEHGPVGLLAMGVGANTCHGGPYTVTTVDATGILLTDARRHRAWLRPDCGGAGGPGCAPRPAGTFATLTQVLTPGDTAEVNIP